MAMLLNKSGLNAKQSPGPVI